jgi:hypothetical protein
LSGAVRISLDEGYISAVEIGESRIRILDRFYLNEIQGVLIKTIVLLNLQTFNEDDI